MKIEIITNRSGIFGGLRRLYILAEYFIEAGHQAIINIEDGSTNNWFKHSVPENQPIEPDIRIVPEVLQKKHPIAKNILYYQAHWDLPENSYDKVITVSNFLKEQLNSNNCESYLIRYGINNKIFTTNPENRIKGTIGYMPRKNKEEAMLIKSMLPQYKFIEIDGVEETEVAKLLQSCDIFLALSRVEGVGLPVIEAALCGALVIGYDGRGGDWINNETFIPASDPIDIVMKVREAIDYRLHEKKRPLAKIKIEEMYSTEKEKEEWLEVVNSLI